MRTITDTTSLGLLIRSERKAQNLTQVQLAGLTGVGVRFLRELEGGKPGCQIGLILKVTVALGIAVYAGVRRERTS